MSEEIQVFGYGCDSSKSGMRAIDFVKVIERIHPESALAFEEIALRVDLLCDVAEVVDEILATFQIKSNRDLISNKGLEPLLIVADSWKRRVDEYREDYNVKQRELDRRSAAARGSSVVAGQPDSEAGKTSPEPGA